MMPPYSTVRQSRIKISWLVLFVALAVLGNPFAGIAQDDDRPSIPTISPPPLASIPSVDPLELYGDTAIYDVFRRGQKVGEHRLHFIRDDDRLSITADLNLEIPFLFFTAYRFTYESSEIWDGEQLIALTANVNDNGKISQTVAEFDGDLFRVDGPRGPSVLTSWIFPTNHWHRGQVYAPVILNTLTGRVSYVNTIGRGIDTVETPSGAVQAEHFEYTGDLRDTEVWYDSDGRWVKMRFQAQGNTTLEYICRDCGPEANEVVVDLEEEEK